MNAGPERQRISTDFPVLVPEWRRKPAQVHAFTTTRSGGVSRAPYQGRTESDGLNLGWHVGDAPQAVAANCEILNRQLPSPVIFLSQMHGNLVVDAENLQPGQSADACIASKPGVVCAVLTADCLPVLFCDLQGRVVGAAHAGWRGLAAGVLQATVAAMRSAGAGEIIAWMGPAIGPGQFEVGQDVVDAFPLQNGSNFFVPQTEPGKYLADIYSLAKSILIQAGVAEIEGGQHCTVTEVDKFYSYRRDRITGRMASLIWID